MPNIFSRRNALLGWVAWRLGRRVVSRKLQRSRSSGSRLLGMLFIASTAALGVGAAAALGHRKDPPEPDSDDWL